MPLRHRPSVSVLASAPSLAAVAHDSDVVAGSIRACLDIDIVLDLTVRAAAQATVATAVAVGLIDNGMLVCRARLGETVPEVGVALNVSSGITGACVRTGQALICNDTETDQRVDAELCRRLGIRSVLVVPVVVEGHVAGLLEVLSGKPQAFTLQHVSWLERVAAFVRVVACARTTVSESTGFRPGTLKPKVPATVKQSPEPMAFEPVVAPINHDIGLSEFREVLEKTGETSSWDDICTNLISKLQQ